MIDAERFRKLLLDRLKELDSRLHGIEIELSEPVTRDWEDAVVEREGDMVQERLGEVSQNEITRIRAALRRIREGTYGTCARCGENIEEARLAVLPDTPLCSSCASGKT